MRFFLTVLIFFTSAYTYAALTQEELSAKAAGILLFNQYKESSPYLLIAAKAGDSEAQFYLAESIRHTKRFIDADAQHWYEASAAQGNIYAMVRLSKQSTDFCSKMQNCPKSHHTPAEWKKLVIELAKNRANTGDSEAAFILYTITSEVSWLEDSAKKGNAKSAWLLANRYKEGEGSFFLSSRQDAIRTLLKQSAEGGFPKGMLEYAEAEYSQGNLDIARHWVELSARSGFETAVIEYGANLAHEPDKLKYSFDPVMGYAIIASLEVLNGGGGSKLYTSTLLPKIMEKMSDEQKKSVAIAKINWAANSSPPSFFPDPLGY